MGRRRSRKAERRQQRRGWAGAWREDPGSLAVWEALDERGPDGAAWRVPFRSGDEATWEAVTAQVVEPEGPVVRTCGSCSEFVEDGELGRGTCLHPGSGVLHPWTDTTACDFWHRGRHASPWRR